MRRSPWPILYVLLGALVVVAAAVSQLAPDNDVVQRFGPNVAAETLGILLTLIFVQRFLERQDRTRRLRSSLGALRRGGRALTRLIDAWGTLIKGGLRDPRYPPETLLELFEAHHTSALAEIDPEAAAEGGGTPWVERTARELRSTRAALREIVQFYGTSLDAEYVEALDSLVDDEFFDIFLSLVEEDGDRRGEWQARVRQTAGAREAHFRRLTALVTLHNQLAGEAAAIRDPKRLPQTRGVGVDLPPDYDLRVVHALDGRWWKGSPAPGTLRNTESRAAAR